MSAEIDSLAADVKRAARGPASTVVPLVSKPGAKSKIVLLDGRALAEPLPAPEYLIREIGLVAGGGAPHLVAGFGFSGKTLAWQSAALSLAAGQQVWGAYRGARPFRVAHVDFEQGRPLTQRRAQRLALASGIDLAALGDKLVVAVMPQVALAASHASSWEQLMAGRDLIIIDSLRAATGGLDENDSSIRAGLDMLGTVSEKTGCRPLVIHHARKPSVDDVGGRYSIRGSSAIYDACDSVYVFSAAKGEPVLSEHVKARSHGEPTESIALVIEDTPIDGDPKAGLRVVVHGAELVTQQRAERDRRGRAAKAGVDADAVRAILRQQPGLGTRDLRAVSGMGADRLAAALASLPELVVRDEMRGRARIARHYLGGGAS